MSVKQGMILAAERLEQMASVYDRLNSQENALANELMHAASVIRQEANTIKVTSKTKKSKEATNEPK